MRALTRRPLANEPPPDTPGTLTAVAWVGWILEGLCDLEVRRGEILGLVGGSGSGKSVLMNTIIGLKEPDGGDGPPRALRIPPGPMSATRAEPPARQYAVPSEE